MRSPTRRLSRVRGIADVLTYPFVVAIVRCLAVLWLLLSAGQAHAAPPVRFALMAYALTTMLFAAGWWHGGHFTLRRDDQHPLALPVIFAVDCLFAALVVRAYGVTLLCMLPALDVAVLDWPLALALLAASDTILASFAIFFQHAAPVGTIVQIAWLSAGPYLAVSYGMQGRFRVERQIRAIDQLLNAGSDLGAQLSLSDVLVQLLNLLRQFRRVVPWDTLAIYIVSFDDEAGEDMLVAVETAGTDAQIYQGKKSAFGDGVVGYSATKQRSALVGDLHKDAREPEPARSPAARACMVVPIVCDHQTVGCVQLLAERPNFYNADQLGLIGRLIGLASVGVRNALLHSSTRAMADSDALTGLLTNRAYHERLEAEFRKAQTSRRSLSLLIVDVDNFKGINDSYGHPVGDEVLRRVGGLIRQQARRNDLCCRYGGDEFVVVMPETIKSDAAVVASRIRKAIEEQTFVFDNRRIPATVSIGAASYPQDVTSKAALIKAADDALYAAKQDGRNALRVFGPPALT